MIKLLKQTDPGILPVVQQIGCYFVSCLAASQIALGKILTADQINDIWLSSVQNGWVINNNMVNPTAVIKAGFEALGLAGVGACNVATQNPDDTWAWIPDWYEGHDFSILLGKTGDSYGTHYRLADAEFEELFNPSSTKIVSEKLRICFSLTGAEKIPSWAGFHYTGEEY